MIKTHKKIVLSLVLSSILSTTVLAQEVRSLEEVTVTAQKSEENVQKVPISVSVFDDISMQDKSISSLDDIAKYTPGLLLFNASKKGLTVPSIRGIYANITSFSSPISMYVDGVPTLNGLGFEDALGDIERIEVLKGPQGTLYGKNSEAGVINIITRKPTNDTKGKIFTTIGSEGKREYGVNVSGAIIEDLFYAGISYKHNEKDGYIKNTLLNKDVNYKDSDYAKLQFRYTPTDNLDISLIGSKHENNDGAFDWALSEQDDPISEANLEGLSKTRTKMLALNIDYNLDNDTKIKSITSIRKYNDYTETDTDFTSATIRHLYKDAEFNTLSQEFRYETQFNDIKIVSGLYLDKTDDDWNVKFVKANGTSSTLQEMESNSIGVFSNIIYPITDKWTLNTGLRYDRENKKKIIKAMDIYLDNDWSNISPKLSLQYDLSKDEMLYAVVAKGYRAGGFSHLGVEGKTSYDEENLISYELGYKAMFLNDSIKLNTSIYYMDISDMQVEEVLMPGVTYMVNAASATSQGIELEFEAMLNNEFTVFSNAGYNKTTFDKFEDLSGDYSGNYNSYAPKYNFNIGTQYRNNKGYYARVELNGYGKTYYDKENKYSKNAYELVNTKIGYETDSFDIYLYANNLFDKKHDATNSYFNGKLTIYKESREFGVKLAYRF